MRADNERLEDQKKTEDYVLGEPIFFTLKYQNIHISVSYVRHTCKLHQCHQGKLVKEIQENRFLGNLCDSSLYRDRVTNL
jgi:hypothetical protein